MRYNFQATFFFLNDLFLYLAIDTVFHPSGIIQNGMEISSKSHRTRFETFQTNKFSWFNDIAMMTFYSKINDFWDPE